MLTNKRVLITGGTGSLGTTLIRRIEEQKWNCQVTVFSRDETRQAKLKSQYPQHRYILGDVSKLADCHRAFRDIDIVFHFAAYKQVPSSQNNVTATMETNIIGSQNVIDAAIDMGVKQVVASSTDKATEPVNFYGVSKAAMESLFQHGNFFGHTTFHLARYGNVVGSNASVIPLFEQQKKVGKPITVTHPEMTRFWISINQAVDLVLHALTQEPGVIVVPKAKAMRVMRVAEIIGGEGYPIQVTAIRSGEKIHEKMVSEAESFYTKQDDTHFYIYPAKSGIIFDEFPFSYCSATCDELSEEELLMYIRDYSGGHA